MSVAGVVIDGRNVDADLVIDHALAQLRHAACFDAAVPLIPRLAPWTDPDRFEPITDVMTGGNLANTYRGQFGEDGRAAISGVFFVGDAVCTINSAAGRGVSLGLRQAQALTAATLRRRPSRDELAGLFLVNA